eukprot:TRINITY_DN466_c0_g1_i2.p1 TRINITY_DN466_c0_g1~~TRINITY_DN466_c0_g1_i2.p1  ORF type:complete len:168 (-),score=19.96 TRINITY_DN466_c0_g1_i2:196-699(-)
MEGEDNTPKLPRSTTIDPLRGLYNFDYTVQKQNWDWKESCATRGAMAMAVGAAFGGFMGLLASSSIIGPVNVDTQLTWRQQFKDTFKDMSSTTWRMSKNFALVGGLFATIECGIDSYRGRHDFGSTIAAGCSSGIIFSYKGGKQAMALGCAGWSGFSVLMEYMMQGH